jgi:hypothetical protein
MEFGKVIKVGFLEIFALFFFFFFFFFLLGLGAETRLGNRDDFVVFYYGFVRGGDIF